MSLARHMTTWVPRTALGVSRAQSLAEPIDVSSHPRAHSDNTVTQCWLSFWPGSELSLVGHFHPRGTCGLDNNSFNRTRGTGGHCHRCRLVDTVESTRHGLMDDRV